MGERVLAGNPQLRSGNASLVGQYRSHGLRSVFGRPSFGTGNTDTEAVPTSSAFPKGAGDAVSIVYPMERGVVRR